MKKIILFLFVMAIASGNALRSQLKQELNDLIKKHKTEVTCTNKKFLSPATFKILSNKFFSRVSNNTMLLNQPTSYASLKLSENNTIADLQSTFSIGEYKTLTAGFKASISDNVTDLYSGEDGILPDWGVRVGYNQMWGNKIFYYKKNCSNLEVARSEMLVDLLDSNSLLFNQTPSDLKQKITELKDRRTVVINSNKIKDKKKELKEINKELDEVKVELEFIEGFYKENGTLDKGKIREYLDKKISDFEISKAKINGYSTKMFNITANFDRKSFNLFFPNQLSVADRFTDTSYSNLGLTVGFSYYRFTSYFSNFSINLGIQNRSNLEQDENQKYNRAYTTKTTIPNGSGPIEQYYSKTKNAFDSTQIEFETFRTVDINAQWTALFGEEKSVGFNVFANYSNSKHYSVPNKLNLGIGPVVSIVNKEDKESKLNFSLFGSFRNVFDDETLLKDKFFVSFNVQVPFSFL